MANGNFGGGDGTQLSPYLVEDAHDLDAVRNYLGNRNVYFKQVSDIDLSSWGNWIPIQNGINTVDSSVFRGNYDGGGYKILNMTCHHNRDYVGLFGYTSFATIKNVFIENCDVTGTGDYIGSLIGYGGSTTISNCYASGSVTCIGDYIGGLAGRLQGGMISNCYASVSVSGESDVGGFVGNGYAVKILNCYASGSASGIVNSVGGLVGSISSSEVSNCYANGNVSGKYRIGGLVGYASPGIISNCYASGSVIGDYSVGGLVGYCSSVTISNCYALNSFIARIAGSTSSSFSDIANGATIENCYSLDTLEFRQL